MYPFLIVLTISCTMGLQAWQTLINNFSVETAHLDGIHIGAIQSVREIPGFLSLLIIFASYTMTNSRVLLTILYILDHLFFNFSMAIMTYFQKVADPRDIAPSMAAGNTINHIAAVALPLIGGLLWIVDYRIPFLIGAGLSLISLIIVQKMRVPAEVTQDPT